MKKDFTFFCRTWIGIAYASGLVIGLPMTPPILDIPRDDLVIPVHRTLSITCRGQRTLAWTWPDSGVVGQELTDRQDHRHAIGTPGKRVVFIRECPGQPERPYCKTLLLNEAQGKDTGYYRCYYKDVKSIIDGTTAISVYVFVKDPAQPFLKRGSSSDGNTSDLETLLIKRSSTHVTVPCLVTVPDLNVTLDTMFPAYPTAVQMSGMKWDNKQGLSIPTHILENMQLTIIACVTTLEGKQHHSDAYILHTTGTQVNDVKLFPEDSMELMVGEALTLNCTVTVEFDTGVDIQWSYPGKKMNRQVEINPYREALSQATEAGSILTIHSVNVTDTGLYICNVTSLEKTQMLQTHVMVHGEPFISLNYTEGPVVEVTDGHQSFILQVNVSAYPTPETQWYKDGVLINTKRMETHSNHSLEIKDVCHADSGLYTVVLRNSAAMLEERLNITLVVNVPPHIHEKEVTDHSSPYLSSNSQTLTCTAYGLPAPNITWQWRASDGSCVLNSSQSRPAQQDRKDWRDGIADSQSWQDIYSQNDMNEIESIETSVAVVNNQEKIVSRLHIHNASVSVMYKCTAENKVGRDERLINFYVTTIPDGFGVDVHPSENPLEQEKVSLHCKADNCYYDQLQWYRLNPQALLDQQGKPQELDCGNVHLNATPLQGQSSIQEHSNSRILDFTIESIRLPDEGHYVCKAQSRHRKEKQCLLRYISVKALEAPRYRRSLTNQTVNVTESLRMECDAEGRPLPHLSWFKDNQPLHQMSGVQLQDSNRTLSIQRVTEEDAGVYTCTACNKRGCVHSSAAIRVIGSSDKANVEIVILIGTGVIAVFFWALLILIFCNVKRVNPADIKTGYLSIIMDPGEVPLDEQCEYLPYDSSQWEISRDRLQLGKVLGHGAFGKVIEASIYGINKSNSLDTVAVKMLKDGSTASEHKALMSELKILIHIGNHLNVVNLLGACTKPNGPLMVIVEYCKYGNLSNFLRAKREFFLPYRDRSPKTQSQVRRMIEAGQGDQRAQQPPCASLSPLSSPQNVMSKAPDHNPPAEKMEDLWKTPLTIEDLICYSFQVARGMEFLASRKCIHRDLAARNILLSENNIVKICDFGLARDIYKDPDYVRKGNARLPLKWMAPESIFDKVYTSQSDVWSFGVLLWEIFSLGASPYPGVQIDEDFCKRLKDGVRMRAPETASPEIYGIMLACWQGEPKERPTFPALVQILGDLLQDNSLPDGKDYIPLNHSQNSEDDGFSQASSRPASEEELRLACNTLPARYYNCVPFAGCVFVGPSKMCQPRVKTFEELPLEMHPHKTPQDNQTDSGMVLASEEFERIEHNHAGAILKSRMSSTSSTEPLTASHGPVGHTGGGDGSRHRPHFFSQLSGQTFYNNEYGHLSEEGFCDFYSPPDTPCLASSNV